MKPYQTGILFVHGIQGNPQQFHFLIDRMPRSVLVRNVLLPGHGAATKEFRKAKAAQWLQAVKEACVDLTSRCEHIVFVGHSMGCLLGLLTEQEQRAFSGMLLICCPFYLRPTLRYFRNSLFAAFKTGDITDPFLKAAREANSVSAKHAFSYLLCIRPYLELLKIIHETKCCRLNIPPQTVFCYSSKDEIVGKKSILYVQNQLSANTEVLIRCGHNYFTSEAQARMVSLLLNMVEHSS